MYAPENRLHTHVKRPCSLCQCLVEYGKHGNNPACTGRKNKHVKRSDFIRLVVVVVVLFVCLFCCSLLLLLLFFFLGGGGGGYTFLA